ncbi:MAG: hypothetical protein DMG13_27860 [Acidobacteria bacterium]|nr:MAG: hypothetical protein DMG13_27860 [Acidobacteriota bacterium]
MQAAQLERARHAYFAPARRTAAACRLRSERGLALCFDIHVQNAGINNVDNTDESADSIAIGAAGLWT